ncbi:MAG: hypothetical protein ACOY30_12595 [Bacillota bacterium]
MTIIMKEVGSVKFEMDGQVGDVLEGLVQKIEKLNREKKEEFEKSRHVLSMMDKLNEAMARLEYQRRREKVMARKIAAVYQQLESGSGVERSSAEIRSFAQIVTSLLNGAKTTGQVIEIVAGSLMVMMETVSNVIKSQKTGTRGYSPGGESKGLDLAALIKPVNAILNSLAAKQQQQQQPTPTPTPTPDSTKVSDTKPAAAEAQPAADTKTAAQTILKDDNTSIPVVRAMPAESQDFEDNG